MTKLTCEQCFDTYMSGTWDYIADDMFWRQDYKSEPLWELLLAYARENKITLVDRDDFDYDTFFYQMYKDTEKGLS